MYYLKGAREMNPAKCGVFIDNEWLMWYNDYHNGNPTSYLGTSATWEKGRALKQYGAIPTTTTVFARGK